MLPHFLLLKLSMSGVSYYVDAYDLIELVEYFIQEGMSSS